MVCLAVAVGLKIYPAIFAFLLLKDKRYWAFFRTVLYSAVFFIAPFFLFGGFESMKIFFAKLLGASNVMEGRGYRFKVNYANTFGYLSERFSLNDAATFLLTKIIPYFMFVLGMIAAFFVKEKWKAVLLFACFLVGIPGFSSVYTLTFFAIPLIFLLNEGRKNKIINYVFLLLMILIMIPKPFGTIYTDAKWYQQNMSISTLLDGLSVIVLTLLAILNGFHDLFHRIKEKHNISIKVSAVLVYGLIAAFLIAEIFIPPYACIALTNGTSQTVEGQQSAGGLPVKILTGEDEEADDADGMKAYSAFMYYSEYAALPTERQNHENIVLVKDGTDIDGGVDLHVEQTANEIPLDQINIVYHDLNVVEGSVTDDFFYTVDEGKFGQIYIHLAYGGWPILIEYTLDSSSNFWGRVLWSEDGVFTEENAVMTEVPQGEYKYKAVLENNPYNVLEIVPCYSPGSYELKDLKISYLYPVRDVEMQKKSMNRKGASVYMATPGILVTDIPYNAFHNAVVNGEEVQAIEVNHGDTGIYLESGQNDIEIYYISRNGKTIYILIGLAAAIFIIFICFQIKKRREKPHMPIE